MRLRYQQWLTLAVVMAVSGPVVMAHPQESSKSESAPSERGEARNTKIEAPATKQKAAQGKAVKRLDEDQKGSDSKARAPIGVNEPGVNRASKPITVNEEDIGSDSKARAPIGVNEPGVNRASKPITVNEEGLEYQPAKGKNPTAPPSTLQASPKGNEKPGKGEPQPAKKQ